MCAAWLRTRSAGRVGDHAPIADEVKYIEAGFATKSLRARFVLAPAQKSVRDVDIIRVTGDSLATQRFSLEVVNDSLLPSIPSIRQIAMCTARRDTFRAKARNAAAVLRIAHARIRYSVDNVVIVKRACIFLGCPIGLRVEAQIVH